MTIRGGGNPHTAMAAMPLGEWTRRLGALLAEAYDCFMVGTPTWFNRIQAWFAGDCSWPMAGSPRIIARPTTRSPAACRRARVRQGQAFGGAKEAPSLTAAARDGDANMRSGRKNACGAGRTKEWNDKGRQKWRDDLLDKQSPIQARLTGGRRISACARPSATRALLPSSRAPLAMLWPIPNCAGTGSESNRAAARASG